MKKCCQANFVRWESAAFPVETLGGLDAGTKKFLNLANMTLNVITMHRLCNCWLINVSWNHRITANFTELQHIVSKNRFSCENMQLWVSLQRAHSSCSLYRHCTIRAQDCTWARNNWTNWFRDTEQVRAALRGQSALTADDLDNPPNRALRQEPRLEEPLTDFLLVPI